MPYLLSIMTPLIEPHYSRSCWALPAIIEERARRYANDKDFQVPSESWFSPSLSLEGGTDLEQKSLCYPCWREEVIRDGNLCFLELWYLVLILCIQKWMDELCKERFHTGNIWEWDLFLELGTLLKKSSAWKHRRSFFWFLLLLSLRISIRDWQKKAQVIWYSRILLMIYLC